MMAAVLGRSRPIAVIPLIVPYLLSALTLSYQLGFVALFRPTTPYHRFLSARYHNEFPLPHN